MQKSCKEMMRIEKVKGKKEEGIDPHEILRG
jgi:hypothetical protein